MFKLKKIKSIHFQLTAYLVNIKFLFKLFIIIILTSVIVFTACKEIGITIELVTGVSLDKTTTSIKVNEVEQLTATIVPMDATNQGVKWTSTDTNIATVTTNGLVTAVSEGKATISVTTSDDSFKANCVVTVPALGDKISCTAENVSFNMVYVPDGMIFPTETDDSEATIVTDAYWIGETEVTYELWSKVYTWATNGNGATGAGQYYFANPGELGGSLFGTTLYNNQNPVTHINWRDSIVWCNALTEWYNAINNTNYTCVYTYNGAIIRDSRGYNLNACDNAVAESNTGYRLLTQDEWQLAARYRGTDTINVVTKTIGGIDFSAMSTKWTKGNSASGATANYTNLTATKNVAIFDYITTANATKTSIVNSKTANTFGLYDMSGNVWEWCYEIAWSGTSNRTIRGGSCDTSADYTQIGYRNYSHSPDNSYFDVGLRFARTQ